MAPGVTWELLEKEELTLVALSGGLDSVCLCALLHEAGYRVAAAHFNHALRGEESERDEQFVRAFCKARNIPLFVGRGDVAACAEQNRIGTEEAGRKLRYEFLEKTARELGAAVIATGHHANDNAETMLFHLARGTGIAGLAGIAPRRGNIVRPLLSVSRTELAAYAAERELSYCEDATNSDENYTRNFIRAQLLPRMEEVNAAAVRHMSEAAQRLREDDELLNALARERLGSMREEKDAVSLTGEALLSAPAALRRRMLRELLRCLQVGEKDFTAAHFTELENLCRDGKMRQLDLPRGVTAYWRNGRLTLSLKEEGNGEAELPMGESVCWGDWLLTLSSEPSDAAYALSADALPLTVGAWDARDRMQLIALPAPRSLKRIFSDRGVTPAERERTAVVRSGGKLAAVCGIGVDAAFLPKEKTCYLTWNNIKE